MHRVFVTVLFLSTIFMARGMESMADPVHPTATSATTPQAPSPIVIDLSHAAESAKTNSGFQIDMASDAVVIPVAPVSPDVETTCYALTVIFDDNGDGGPVVEWSTSSGDRALLCAGLGTVGTAIGLERRTLLLPQNLTLAGGTVSVSFAGRFSRLRAIELSPCADITVSAPTGIQQPALLTATGKSLSKADVSGDTPPLIRGDLATGNVVRAELAASPASIGNGASLEVIVPMPPNAGDSFLKAEVSGLDPASRIEVSVNGNPMGSLGLEEFPLEDPGTLRSPGGRLLRAGWRSGSLFIPSGSWHQGDNSVVFSLSRAPGDSGDSAHLRNAVAEILFGSTNAPAPGMPNTLSNGSIYGNPSPALFHATLPSPLSPGTAPSSVGP